ncbi:hypothetical protein VSK92_06935 [Bacillus swezeyi]
MKSEMRIEMEMGVLLDVLKIMNISMIWVKAILMYVMKASA